MSTPPEKGSALPFILAVVIPVIGFVLGVIEATKRSAGRGAAIMAVSLVAGFVWYSVVLTSTGQDKCAVLTLGGNKLCGDDARAWCDSTDSLRALVADTESQRVCDDLRGRATATNTPTDDSADTDGDGFDDWDDDYPEDPTRWDATTP